MPGLPVGDVSKGSVLQKMDKAVKLWITSGEIDKLDALIYALETNPSYLATLEQYLGVNVLGHDGVNAAEIEYLREYWYTPDHPECFWPSIDLGVIVRRGKAHALRLAREHQPHPLPIESYWEPIDSQEFKVIVMPSEQQVTCILRTAKPQFDPKDPPVPHRSRVPIWVTEREDGQGDIVTRNVQDFAASPGTSTS